MSIPELAPWLVAGAALLAALEVRAVRRERRIRRRWEWSRGLAAAREQAKAVAENTEALHEDNLRLSLEATRLTQELAKRT